MKNEEWCKNQIKGLILILEDNEETFIAKDYIIEKLNMMLSLESGIGFHESIRQELKIDYKGDRVS